MQTFTLIKEPAAHFLAFYPKLARPNHVFLQIYCITRIVGRVTVVAAADEIVHLQEKNDGSLRMYPGKVVTQREHILCIHVSQNGAIKVLNEIQNKNTEVS